jgi:hypothetical protein
MSQPTPARLDGVGVPRPVVEPPSSYLSLSRVCPQPGPAPGKRTLVTFGPGRGSSDPTRADDGFGNHDVASRRIPCGTTVDEPSS